MGSSSSRCSSSRWSSSKWSSSRWNKYRSTYPSHSQMGHGAMLRKANEAVYSAEKEIEKYEKQISGLASMKVQKGDKHPPPAMSTKALQDTAKKALLAAREKLKVARRAKSVTVAKINNEKKDKKTKRQKDKK